MASFITLPERHGEPQPSSLGLLHSRGRLGRERVGELLGGAPFRIRQDHSQRGLVSRCSGHVVAPGTRRDVHVDLVAL